MAQTLSDRLRELTKRLPPRSFEDAIDDLWKAATILDEIDGNAPTERKNRHGSKRFAHQTPDAPAQA